MTVPTDSITIRVDKSEISATDWKLYILDGRKFLTEILGRNPKNIHWIPNPEIVRLHGTGQSNLFKLAESFFELETAKAAAASAGRALRWRFVDKHGKPIQITS